MQFEGQSSPANDSPAEHRIRTSSIHVELSGAFRASIEQEYVPKSGTVHFSLGILVILQGMVLVLPVAQQLIGDNYIDACTAS